MGTDQEVTAMSEVPITLAMIPDLTMLATSFDAGLRLFVAGCLAFTGVGCMALVTMALLEDETPPRVDDTAAAHRAAA
jgi:hypothetical protein